MGLVSSCNGAQRNCVMGLPHTMLSFSMKTARGRKVSQTCPVADQVHKGKSMPSQRCPVPGGPLHKGRCRDITRAGRRWWQWQHGPHQQDSAWTSLPTPLKSPDIVQKMTLLCGSPCCNTQITSQLMKPHRP